MTGISAVLSLVDSGMQGLIRAWVAAGHACDLIELMCLSIVEVIDHEAA